MNFALIKRIKWHSFELYFEGYFFLKKCHTFNSVYVQFVSMLHGMYRECNPFSPLII